MEIFLVKELRVRGSSLNKLTLSINQSLMRIRYNISKFEGQDAIDKNMLLKHLRGVHRVLRIHCQGIELQSFSGNSFQRHLYYCYYVIHFACEFVQSIFEVYLVENLLFCH